MGKINILQKHVAELIAAGEVVERPASVIKELVENAIDAGSGVLTVEIQNGGTTLMRLTDNGIGIEREDIPTAFLRHATSKVTRADDLDAITTLGFRGEALASIAAVSRVELLTAVEGAPHGYCYRIEGGEETLFEETGCPKGTTILVRDLFYNVPARMKFLKKDITESNAIAAMMDRIALSHPEISIRLIRDGKETLRTPGDGKLKSAIFAVYGKEFTQNLIKTEYSLGGVTLSGYIGQPSAARPNRNMQVFFINGRYVKTLTGMAALEQAYKGSVMAGKFPACVLHLTLPPEVVDVNVHPAKTEVRFTNDKPVFDAVYHGVKSALMAGDRPREMSLPKPLPTLPVTMPEGQAQVRLNDLIRAKAARTTERAAVMPDTPTQPSMARSPAPPVPPARYASTVSIDIAVEDEPVEVASATPAPPKVEPDVTKPDNPEPAGTEPVGAAQDELRKLAPEETRETEPNADEVVSALRYVGELFTTYALFEAGDRLVLLDKHAAHERIIYEKFKQREEETHAQLLLSPISLTPAKEEFSVLLEHHDLLMEAGFEVEEFGPGTLLIRTVPSILDHADAAGQLLEIAQRLLLGRPVETEHLDWIYHNMACRAAVKAGTKSSREELALLVERTLADPALRYCPHGRPTTVVLTRKELEKQFGRIQ